MSLWNSDNDNSTVDLEDVSQYPQDFSKKAYTKMDPKRKLLIIYALDNGQLKTDIAREYGVHPHTITYIYKQKETILKKYSNKYKLLNEDHCVNLDQVLMDWLSVQTKTGNVVTEAKLREKALEEVTNSSEQSSIDDWLVDFRIRHNIQKYTPTVKFSSQAKDEWMRLHINTDARDLYIGSTSALLHTLGFDNFVNGQDSNDYMSLLLLVNSSGCDKKKLVVVGKESLDNEINIKSVPVNYYRCDLPQVNTTVISNYLDKWNTDLKCKGRNVVVVMSLSDNFVESFSFSNIKLINSLNMEFVTKTMETIVECFKYHYRRLQITRNTISTESCTFKLVDYIDMISAAWHNISNYYIQQLFFPPEEDSLYFNLNDDDFADNHSLSHWCRMLNIPMDLDLYSNVVDEYIFCDKKLTSLNLEQTKDQKEAPTEFIPENIKIPSTSGIEAFQAMKRLVSYLQGESAKTCSIQSAKTLENHLECGALSEINDIVSSTNDSAKE